jgi:hypothetical protein
VAGLAVAIEERYCFRGDQIVDLIVEQQHAFEIVPCELSHAVAHDG